MKTPPQQSFDLDERQARKLVLAQAIETSDTQRKLLTDVERDRVDLEAVELARKSAGPGGDIDVTAALCRRADLVLAAVEKRNATLASLKEPPPWRPWLMWGIPLACLILGIATDRIANPHRIDLLSFPFFAVCLWNLAVYAFLFVELFRHRFVHETPRWSMLQRLVDGIPRSRWRGGKLGAEVMGRFLVHWQRASAALNGQRIRQLLHLSAAAWGAGITLSLFLYGLTVEYRVGWESTFLNAEQLHRILGIVFAPVVALFSLEPFTLQDIAGMKLGPGAEGAAVHGRRWVYLYASLMIVIVVLPRLLLAAAAALRARLYAHRIRVDASDPYFQRLIDQLRPAELTILVCTHRTDDRSALLKALAHRVNLGVNGVLIGTAAGDSMRIADLPAEPARGEQSSPPPSWRQWLRADRADNGDAGGEAATPEAGGDLVLHVVGDATDLASADAPLDDSGKPVLIAVNPPPADAATALLAQCELHRRHHERVMAVLGLDEFGRCWVQERTLLDAIGKCVPRSKEQGFGRLVTAWENRNSARFQASMSALASALRRAAREVEEVKTAPLSLRHVFSKSHRGAHEQAKEDAMQAIAGRLQTVFAGALADLMKLHGIDPAQVAHVEHGAEGTFDFRSSIDTPHAGMAGAATGAAMGASVDLLTGGLTLGVAALLGALVGGSAGFIGAAWKNRDSPSGASSVQLSDTMLVALAEASLLRYLAVIHFDRYGSASAIDERRPEWVSETGAVVAARRNALSAAIESARFAADSPAATAALGGVLEDTARQVLAALYPQRRAPRAHLA